MLTELGIENFKPFGRQQVAELAPITLIYGPNSGGKSSILQSLLLIRQSLAADQTSVFRLVPRGYYVDLGSFRNLLHQHDLNRSLRIRIRYRTASRPPNYVRVPEAQQRSVTLDFKAASWPGRTSLDTSELSAVEYGINEGACITKCRFIRSTFPTSATNTELVLYDWADNDSPMALAKLCINPSNTELLGPGAPTLEGYTELNKRFLAVVSGSLPFAVVQRPDNAAGPDPLESSYGGFILGPCVNSLRKNVIQLMESLQYLGPLRSVPERHYSVVGNDRTTVGARGESMAQVIYRGSGEVLNQVNQWFCRLGMAYRMKVDLTSRELAGEAIALTLADSRSGLNVGPSDVGFGVGQLLPILVQGVVSRSQVLCVEQPEIHLHPRLQANLADFFIDTAGLNRSADGPTLRSTANQWIIETHSEALMLRLQRRIREGKLDPSSVSVLYVNPSDKVSADILRLRMNARGDFIDPWPDGFFEEGYREMFPGGN